jgi:hypothetical protein
LEQFGGALDDRSVLCAKQCDERPHGARRRDAGELDRGALRPEGR